MSRFRDRLQNSKPLTRGDLLYYLFIGFMFAMELGAVLMGITVYFGSEAAEKSTRQTKNDLQAVYALLRSATLDEYGDMTEEIRHSLVRLSVAKNDTELVNMLPNTSENCPLHEESYPAQVYLVAMNTGELYPLDVYDGKEKPRADGTFGHRTFSAGFDEISLTQIAINTHLDEGYTETKLRRYEGIFSYQRIKSNFCDACIQRYMEISERADVCELVFFDSAAHEIIAVNEMDELPVGDYALSVGAERWSYSRYDDYIVKAEYTGAPLW